MSSSFYHTSVQIFSLVNRTLMSSLTSSKGIGPLSHTTFWGDETKDDFALWWLIQCRENNRPTWAEYVRTPYHCFLSLLSLFVNLYTLKTVLKSHLIYKVPCLSVVLLLITPSQCLFLQPLHSLCCYPTSFQQMIMFLLSLSEFIFCSENKENLRKNGVRQPWRGSSHTLIAGSRKRRILLTTENINLLGILFPALKKEESSLFQQQSSNHSVQVVRKHQNCINSFSSPRKFCSKQASPVSS